MRAMRAGWLVIATGMALAAQPVEARKRFGFGGGSSRAEKILGVRDLPDTETFRRDGAYWDLGLLYTERSVLGMTVSGSPSAGRPVLYHGDQYIEMTPDLQAALTGMFGEDIVANAQRDAAKAAEMPSGGGAETTSGGDRGAVTAGIGGALLTLLAMIAAAIVGVKRLLSRGRKQRPRRPADAEAADAAETLDTDSFDRRVAARLAELRGEAPTGAAMVAPAPMPAAAEPVRSFGRKGLG